MYKTAASMSKQDDTKKEPIVQLNDCFEQMSFEHFFFGSKHRSSSLTATVFTFQGHLFKAVV